MASIPPGFTPLRFVPTGLVVAALCALGLALAAPPAEDAYAHCDGSPKGGPGGPPPSVPPSSKPPSAPKPVAPPTTPKDGGGKKPQGRGGDPPPTKRGGGSRKMSAASAGAMGDSPRARNPSALAWQWWWWVNEAGVRITPNSGDRPSTPDSPLFRVGEGESGNRSDEGRARRRAVRTHALPALRSVVATPGEDPDVLAAAVLALGKVAETEEDVRLIAAATASPEAVVTESAVLAQGLLRRSDAEDRFPARVLDRVRDRLFTVLDDLALHAEARAFAAFGLGLLADQPTEEDGGGGTGPRRVVRGLWTRLRDADEADEERDVALLAALSLHPPAAVPDVVKDELRALLATGRLGTTPRGPLARGQAAITLARLGCTRHAGAFAAIVGLHTFDAEVRRSCAIALGTLAPDLEPDVRVLAARACVAAVGGADPDTAGALLLGASRILRADFDSGSALVEEKAKVTDAVVRALEGGRHDVNGIAAIALATAACGSEAPARVPEFAALRARTAALLRRGVEDEGQDVLNRAAFCVALGLFGDPRAAGTLDAVLASPTVADVVRAHACWGLGMLGRVPPDVLSRLREAAHAGSTDAIRRDATRALGLLRDTESAPLFVAHLERGGHEFLLARAALALGDLRDAAAVPALADLGMSRAHAACSRWAACSALGLIGDPEPEPSLRRLAVGSNYVDLTDALAWMVFLL